MSMTFHFPPGMALPALMIELQYELPWLFDDDASVGDGFAFYAQAPIDTALWFARKTSPSILAAANKLGVFGSAPEGSLFALWQSPRGDYPVICLGSEGGTQVLAASFADFLRLLAIGYGALETAGVYDEPPEEDAGSPLLRDWLVARGLNVPRTGEQIVSDAVQAHPDFHGWCEDAIHGVLEGAVSIRAVDIAPESMAEMPGSLWDHLVSVIGKPSNSPQVVSLLKRLQARALSSTHPDNPDTHIAVQDMGIEIEASCALHHRQYWPPRREGRVYVSYVHRIRLSHDAYGGPLPMLENWPWDVVTESSRTWQSPDRSLRIKQDFEEGTLACTYLALPEERAYITASPAYEIEKPLVYVEDAFFATWCALNGLLDAEKFNEKVVQPWRQRTQTPLTFLHVPCDNVLWSGDIPETFASFISAYYLGFCESEEQTWRSDIKQVFGSSNHFRKGTDVMTPDSWDAYDRISKRIVLRFTQWKLGKLRRREW